MPSAVDGARDEALDGRAAWPESFDELFAQVAGVFGNAAVRRHGRWCLLGLLSRQERKNSWRPAEFAGDVPPDGMQRLLNFPPWDEDAARDALARYVARRMGDPAAVPAAGETGFFKKGKMPAGVARMYTGTAGRAENCQAGVFAAYVTPDGGRALAGRELCLPGAWTGDRERCQRAGIGNDAEFAAKPELAWTMIERAAGAGIPFAWVAGGEVHGGGPELRKRLEEHGIPYVMAVSCDAMIATAAGSKRAGELAGLVPRDGRQRLSCAGGSRGPRLYDWAPAATASPQHHLPARRSLQPGEKGVLELAFFRCWSPRPVTLAELIAVAGARRGAEDCFAEAKGEAGLDRYQVREYRAWHRHAALSMLAHAFLSVTARDSRPRPPAGGDDGEAPAKKGDLTPADNFSPRPGHTPRQHS